MSPGTVLIMRMPGRLLERVREFDLNAADDPYKGLWASRRGEGFGSVGYEPLIWRGAAIALCHILAAAFTRRAGGREARGRATRYGDGV
jgi:CelD/BcsL family acetyltransferase involved in cellulose biosynthesis